MYRWYQKAHVCYVYLSDVESGRYWERQFRDSRWFTRGWTLQELIAPSAVKFFDKEWQYLGDIEGLSHMISQITRIDWRLLLHTASLEDFCVAQRMSWAACRRTTRIEDRAYSLVGIFNVHLPTLYGEGDTAFLRLQEQIMLRSTDHSIFAWGHGISATNSPVASRRRFSELLASSPDDFAKGSEIVLTHGSPPIPFSMTNRGLRITLPTLQNVSEPLRAVAFLNCRPEKDALTAFTLNLKRVQAPPLRLPFKFFNSWNATETECGVNSECGRLRMLGSLNYGTQAPATPLMILNKTEMESTSPWRIWNIGPTRQVRVILDHVFGGMKLLRGYPPDDWDLNIMTMTQTSDTLDHAMSVLCAEVLSCLCLRAKFPSG
jgi:hypothetical protein